MVTCNLSCPSLKSLMFPKSTQTNHDLHLWVLEWRKVGEDHRITTNRRSWCELSKLENVDKRPEGRHNMNNGMVNKQKCTYLLIKKYIFHLLKTLFSFYLFYKDFLVRSPTSFTYLQHHLFDKVLATVDCFATLNADVVSPGMLQPH